MYIGWYCLFIAQIARPRLPKLAPWRLRLGMTFAGRDDVVSCHDVVRVVAVAVERLRYCGVSQYAAAADFWCFYSL